MNSTLSVPLAKATVQEIQLELIRRSSFNAFDGELVARSLLAHRHLWTAVLMDRFGFDLPLGKLPSGALIKLRDLDDNLWNVDTLYILVPNADCAKETAEQAKTDNWGGEQPRIYADHKEVDNALGGGESGQAIVSIWWD